MKKLRAVFRGATVFFIIVCHVSWMAVYTKIRGVNLPYALKIRQLCLNRCMRRLGFVIEQHGGPPAGNHIFVCNHRSYIDPIIPLSEIDALAVGKAEVSKWPIIGYGARQMGIIFVQRELKPSRTAALDAMRVGLMAGYPILLFPEGTTHTLPHTIDFRPGGFFLAAKEGFSIVPMAIDFQDMGDAWVGDDLFLPHFMQSFGKKETHVRIRYGQPIRSEDGKFLLDTCKKWIDDNMAIIRAEFDQRETRPARVAFEEA
ncbi:MAG: 1-acyl-sn-glycerol-3-phosphate acyltransferase [Bacteroidetes bacterium]|nr:1-acyl-sn-glycerol-3-phosphate acyltransferase [Bacteroidota bacterium]